MTHRITEDTIVIPHRLYAEALEKLPKSVLSDILEPASIPGMGKVGLYKMNNGLKHTADESHEMIRKATKGRLPMWSTWLPLLVIPIYLLGSIYYGVLTPEIMLLTVMLAGSVMYWLLSIQQHYIDRTLIAIKIYDVLTGQIHLAIKEKLLSEYRLHSAQLETSVELCKMDMTELEVRYQELLQTYHQTNPAEAKKYVNRMSPTSVLVHYHMETSQ